MAGQTFLFAGHNRRHHIRKELRKVQCQRNDLIIHYQFEIDGYL